MEIDKKKVLDELYILKDLLVKKAHQENSDSIEYHHNNDVCLTNLASGRSQAYEKSFLELDETIKNIINF